MKFVAVPSLTISRASTIVLLASVLLAACNLRCSSDPGASEDLQRQLDTTFDDDPDPTEADLDDATAVDQAGDSVANGDLNLDQSTDGRVAVDSCPDGVTPIDEAALPIGFCSWLWAEGLRTPRGLVIGPDGETFVVERGLGQVTVLWDDDGDNVNGSGERAALASAEGLNHGVALNGGWLYASSDTTVYRWPYESGDRDDLGEAQVVVHGIPGGGHSTRTLVFDEAGFLYVSVGSGSNVDRDSSRSRLVRYPVSDLTDDGFSFSEGEVFADGLRNEVGLAFDSQGRLWGVENGFDRAFRADLGGDIHEDNPAEELNLFLESGRFYGYPYCWSEFLLPDDVGGGPTTQWAHENFMNDGVHSDSWCRDSDNVIAPVLAMQAHSAPLDITFYDGISFPGAAVGDAFIAFHGSWNRDEPTGYKVVRVDFRSGSPVGLDPFFEYAGGGDIGEAWPHRPVAIGVHPDGNMLVTSDVSGVVISIGYTPPTD